MTSSFGDRLTPPGPAGPPNSLEAWVEAAVARLAVGGFIAYPTETVWGLGACADRPDAVRRLIDWKGRGSDAPLAVLVDSPDHAQSIGCEVGSAARHLMDGFWPGPLMLVVPCRSQWAPGVAGPTGALGLRCSPHAVAGALARAVAEAGLGPLTSTSFNRSGAPPVATRAAAEALLADGPTETADSGAAAGTGEAGGIRPLSEPWPLFAAGQEAGGERPSTVVDCTGTEPAILREGAIATAAIRARLGG